MTTRKTPLAYLLLWSLCWLAVQVTAVGAEATRERISINDGWRFIKDDPADLPHPLMYDVRPEVTYDMDGRPADAEPRPPEVIAKLAENVAKPWILPTGNRFLKDVAKHHRRPVGNWGGDVPYVQTDFDDRDWQQVNLPHDWAITGPWITQGPYGGMGRLPSWGIGWYRKKLDIPASDAGKRVYLEVDGAMAYSIVWLNGQIVGGWPFGYASWRLDLTPYLTPGGENQLVIRLDNPVHSSRWYPGGGLYRNVWLTKTQPVHVGQWGTYVKTREVSAKSALVDLEVTIDNTSEQPETVRVATEVFALDAAGQRTGRTVARFAPVEAKVAPKGSAVVNGTVTVKNPRLWGPPPTQKPHLYVAVTTVQQGNRLVDRYETRFGIRDLRFDPNRGVIVNGELVYFRGVNQHHDLGALGAAFNLRAAERQLELLREVGANSIRMAHNPPAPELLELTDRTGFLVINELFDVWERRKAPLDFHLIFPDWHEQDTRAWVRRDRNHPSVILWSPGNEVGEQYTGEAGAAVARRLFDIIKDEDPTRPTSASMNFAKPDMPFPATMDVISLNYQGEGIRNAPGYEHLQGIRTPPLYPTFRDAFPDKLIVSSENAAALSSRGEYLFPVAPTVSAPVADGAGGDPVRQHVSSYELYTAQFGSSADKVFGSLERHPFVGGGFVWSGWDYLGEPTPYYGARSSYFGLIDLAGFRKDRFYLYQSHWRPDHRMAHILPHWNWPERVGEITPVHVFTSGDEAELFLNGKSLGRKRKEPYEYRLRWDDVGYAPGVIEVVAYKDGRRWATASRETTDAPAALRARADREQIKADGLDLAFITVELLDQQGRWVPNANNRLRFRIEGPGEIVATDNGDPTSFELFQAQERAAFNGLALVIVRATPHQPGRIQVHVTGDGLKEGVATVRTTR
jgi:beta-galactosidase